MNTRTIEMNRKRIGEILHLAGCPGYRRAANRIREHLCSGRIGIRKEVHSDGTWSIVYWGAAENGTPVPLTGLDGGKKPLPLP